MLDSIKILYKELQYRILKQNPEITDENLEKELKKASNIKSAIALGSFFCVVPGLLLFTTFLRSDTINVSSLLVSLALMSLLFSLVSTATQSSFIVVRGVFDPLKVLPIDHGTLYLSGLLSISILPVLFIALPGLVYVLVKYPLSGILATLWVLTGIFAGHTLGLFAFSVVGLKIKHKPGRKGILGTLTNILAFALYIGSFLVMIQIANTEAFAEFIGEYPLVYPFSVATVFEPLKSTALLGGHVIIFVLVYIGSLKKLWNIIVEPQYVSEPGGITPFHTSFGNDIAALSVKDFRILFKQTSLLVGFLAPVTSVLVLFFIIPSEEGFIEPGTLIPLFLVGIIAAATSSVSLTLDGTSLDFLRMLPLKKRRFALSKAVTVMIFPVVFSFLYVVFFGLYDRGVLYFLPYAFAFPVISSLFSMAYYFRYPSDEVGMPKSSWGKVIMLTCSVVLLLGLVGLPVVVIGGLSGYVVGYVCSGGIILVLLWWFMKV